MNHPTTDIEWPVENFLQALNCAILWQNEKEIKEKRGMPSGFLRCMVDIRSAVNNNVPIHITGILYG